MKQISVEYNLGNVFMPSFLRKYGYQVFSAEDAANVINAILAMHGEEWIVRFWQAYDALDK